MADDRVYWDGEKWTCTKCDGAGFLVRVERYERGQDVCPVTLEIVSVVVDTGDTWRAPTAKEIEKDSADLDPKPCPCCQGGAKFFKGPPKV